MRTATPSVGYSTRIWSYRSSAADIRLEEYQKLCEDQGNCNINPENIKNNIAMKWKEYSTGFSGMSDNDMEGNRIKYT